MNNQQSNSDQHMLELLPWYANGTLSDNEKAEVSTWLATHPEHLEELEFLKQMQHETNEEIEVPAPDVQRLMQKLDEHETTAVPSFVVKAKTFLNSLFTPTMAWTAVPVALALAVSLLWMPDQNTLNGSYETLSSGETPSATMISITTTNPGEAKAIAKEMQTWLPAANINMDNTDQFVVTIPAETDADEILTLLNRMQLLPTIRSAELMTEK